MSATGAQVVQALPLANAIARRHSHKLADPAHDRDDLRQAAAIGILKAAASWDGEVSSFESWAWTRADGTVRNLIRDSVPGSRPDRSGKPLRTVSLHTPVPGVEGVTLADTIPAPTVDHDLRLTMQQAIDGLPAHERVVVTGWLAGLSQSEIAGRLDLTKHAVNKRFTKALGRLRALPDVQDWREAA